jgi:LysM repeat protein
MGTLLLSRERLSILCAILGLIFSIRRRLDRLHKLFGTEYEHTVESMGPTRKHKQSWKSAETCEKVGYSPFSAPLFNERRNDMKILKLLVALLFIVVLAVPLQPATAQDQTPQYLCGETYLVQRGDTLWEIAQRCGTTVADLLAVNPQITDARLIFARQLINIPGDDLIPLTGVIQSQIPVPVTGPGTALPYYIVKPGDSLSYLADRYNTSVDAFLDANPFLREERLQVGMILEVPTRMVTRPTVVISPTAGLPGTVVQVVAGGLRANEDVQIGAGRLGEGYFQLRSERTDSQGRIDTTVQMPTWANLDEIWRVVIDRTDTTGIDAASNEFYVVQRSNRVQPIQYLIRPGDTLSWISVKFAVPIADILELNPQITDPRRITTGQYLLIPGPDMDEDFIPETGQPHVTVSPPSPAPGTTFTILATGFPVGAEVDIWIGQPGESPAIIESTQANQQGVVFVNIPLAAGTPRQEWVAFVITRDRTLSVLSQPFTPGVTVVPVTGDPRHQLGSPAFRDTFVDGRHWLISEGTFTSSRIVDGSMELTAHTAADGWRLTWPVVEEYYLEMTVRTGEMCLGGDRYGLFVNLPEDRKAPHTGNQFGVTCNGHYFVRAWHGSSGDWLVTPTPHSAINTHAEQTNRLGIIVEGARMTLFINGERITDVTDATYAGRGRFGVFMGAPETGEFTIQIDEIAYWNLQ